MLLILKYFHAFCQCSIFTQFLHKWKLYLNCFQQAQSVRTTSNKSSPSTDQILQYEHCTKSQICSNLTIKRSEQRQRCLSVNFIVNFTYSRAFIVHFEHISHLAPREYAKKRPLCQKKETEVISLTDCRLKCFSSKI